MDVLKVGGKIGKLYFSVCPNCKKHIVNTEETTVICSSCKKEYKVQYPETK